MVPSACACCQKVNLPTPSASQNPLYKARLLDKERFKAVVQRSTKKIMERHQVSVNRRRERDSLLLILTQLNRSTS